MDFDYNLPEQDLNVSCGPQPIPEVPSSHDPQLLPEKWNETKYVPVDSSSNVKRQLVLLTTQYQYSELPR